MKIQQQYYIILFVLSGTSIVNAEKFRDLLKSLGEYHLIGNGALILKPREMTTSHKLSALFNDIMDKCLITKVNQADFNGKMSKEFWEFMNVEKK